MRNPERIVSFLECISPYEGEKLTPECIRSIVRNVIQNKLYVPLFVIRNPMLREIEDSDDATFSDEQLSRIISASPQHHKEAGFAPGWPSRFDTWYKLQKELGFLHTSHQSLRPMKISDFEECLKKLLIIQVVDNLLKFCHALLIPLICQEKVF